MITRLFLSNQTLHAFLILVYIFTSSSSVIILFTSPPMHSKSPRRRKKKERKSHVHVYDAHEWSSAVLCCATHVSAGGRAARRFKKQQRHKPIHRTIIKTDSLHNSLKIMANWFLSVGEEYIVRCLPFPLVLRSRYWIWLSEKYS